MRGGERERWWVREGGREIKIGSERRKGGIERRRGRRKS